MFRTFRHRLLFWFLVFISSSIIIISLSVAYLQKRESIFSKTEMVESAYITLLKSVKSQQDFISYEIINEDYFKTEESYYLRQYVYWFDSVQVLLKEADFRGESDELANSITQLRGELGTIDTLFQELIQLGLKRGYKSYGLEGEMRTEVHWLEEISEIPAQQILQLRRYEKDYIIRNDGEYVVRLSQLVREIREDLENSNLNSRRRKEILNHLNAYEQLFVELVTLEQQLGIKDNSGLKLELDDRISLFEAGFGLLVNQTREWTNRKYQSLTIYFGLTTLALLMTSVFLSSLIARKITQPLTELTVHITKFVDSNFTLESEHPISRSKDEIGKLTENFSILKDEVISRLKFFKQKVDERTAELAEANTQLQKISEANSRFVPKEFLHYLGRDSIEQVKLGDQVEREMTVIFCDIREFTKISENLSPQQNFDFINQYLAGIVPIIQKNGGFIDKYIGDSVMALFPDTPDSAIKTVFEFEVFLKSFNKKFAHESWAPIHIGTGIHTGNLILGTIGHDHRLETTVISDAVNTAARIEGLTKHYGAKTIGSENTLHNLKNPQTYACRFLDNVRVKGKTKSLAVYEFLSPEDEIKLSYQPKYEEAMALIVKKKIKEAASILEELNKLNPQDKAVEIFLERCIAFLSSESSKWEDVAHMITK